MICEHPQVCSGVSETIERTQAGMCAVGQNMPVSMSSEYWHVHHMSTHVLEHKQRPFLMVATFRNANLNKIPSCESSLLEKQLRKQRDSFNTYSSLQLLLYSITVWLWITSFTHYIPQVSLHYIITKGPNTGSVCFSKPPHLNLTEAALGCFVSNCLPPAGPPSLPLGCPVL